MGCYWRFGGCYTKPCRHLRHWLYSSALKLHCRPKDTALLIRLRPFDAHCRSGVRIDVRVNVQDKLGACVRGHQLHAEQFGGVRHGDIVDGARGFTQLAKPSELVVVHNK